MAQSLRLLIAEDSPADAELVIRALRRSGFAPEWTRVDNEADFLAGLNDEVELVLSDFDMPQFTGFVALQLVQQRMPDVPLLIPGLGAQGGDLETLRGARRLAPSVINVSRGILYADEHLSFSEKAKDYANRIASLS